MHLLFHNHRLQMNEGPSVAAVWSILYFLKILGDALHLLYKSST